MPIREKERRGFEIRKLIFHINDFGINVSENELVAANSCGRKYCANQDSPFNIILSIIHQMRWDF